MQVCGRKARGPENLLRLDTAVFKEVTKESRDVSGLGAREVLVARGCWAAVLAAIIATVLTTAELAGVRLLNHRESEVLVIIEVVQDRGVSLGEGFSLRELKSSENDGLENISDIDVAFEEFQRLQSIADIAEVAIDVSLGVAIPGHEAAKFASKQDSLHALMVEREHSEERVPYLLSAKFFWSDVLGEDGDSVSAARPQSSEAAIKQVFDNVTVVRVQGHPGALFMVVHSEFF